jgi:hypothetical protein
MQGMKIEAVISHLHLSSVLGYSMVMNINYLQLLSGLEIPVLFSSICISYITENWLSHQTITV